MPTKTCDDFLLNSFSRVSYWVHVDFLPIRCGYKLKIPTVGCTVFAIQYEAVHGLRYPHDPWCVFLCYFAARAKFHRWFLAPDSFSHAFRIHPQRSYSEKSRLSALSLLASPNENRGLSRQFSRFFEAITQCITAFIVQLETAMATMTTTTTTTTTTTSRDEFLESCAADQGLGTVTFYRWDWRPFRCLRRAADSKNLGFSSVQIYV